MADDPLFYDYDLPRELVAQEPTKARADARLMVLDRRRDTIEHRHFRDLPDLIRRGDRIVLNDTKVIPAQLVGVRAATGGAWRGLFLSAEPDGAWTILCKTRGRLRPGEVICLFDREGRESERLRLVDRTEGGRWIARTESEAPPSEVLGRAGRTPLPHYIRGGRMIDADVEDYQTVYARRPGAVAAPTAGLHFTKPLLRDLEARGAEFTAVTLHVGMGTFQPITTGSAEEHKMHAEWCELTPSGADQVNATRAAGGRLIAVGTTTVRTLETAAASATEGAAVGPFAGDTSLFVRPGHQFRAVDALVTNFHFPRTTLLLLVQAFGGVELVRRAYDEAIRERYRFFSYGDAMLIV